MLRVSGGLAEAVQVAKHGPIRLAERAELVVLEPELGGGVGDDLGDNRIAVVRDRGEQVVHGLVVEAAGEPVPEVGADAPVSGADDLFLGPVEVVGGDQVVLKRIKQ